MALTRRSGRVSASIWPGFVDAMTALLLVLMFVLTIFMILQYVLQQTITGQESELDELAGEITTLSKALGLEQQRAANLEDSEARLTSDLAAARGEIDTQSTLIATLNAQISDQQGQLDERAARITSFEAQVASLIAARDEALAKGEQLASDVTALQVRSDQLLSEQEALQLALATARQEIDAKTEEARLAAARREALEAMTANLRSEREDLQGQIDDAEAARLADAAAAEALREKLKDSNAELTAMTLALEAKRKEAEDTLTLLAAARAAKDKLASDLADAKAEAEGGLTEADRVQALLAVANTQLQQEEAKSAEGQRKIEVLNQQIAALRGQLGSLQNLLDEANTQDEAAKVQIDALGSQLNTALARVAAEQRRRAELEEAERKRLEAQTQDLERYRSEFFGQLRDLLSDRQGVQIVGDRFVFSSEVLFELGSAELSPEGRAQIADVAKILLDVADQIPSSIDWILRVDGHTDNIPITGGIYADNWELSQARALSVVRYMISSLGFPPQRLAAAGFGEFRPVNPADTPEARAQNRRIELKLTER